MADPMNPAAPAARNRPTSVTVSSYLLILVAVLQVIGLGVALSVLNATREAYKEAFAGTSMADQAETFAVGTLIVTAVIGLLVAAGLIVLALINNRGKNASRIVTWVLGGLYVCCQGVGLAFSAAGSAVGMNNSDNANAPSQEEIRRVLDERLPSWYEPVSLALGVITVLALLAALILLALPSSNEFFRRPQTTAWEPPVPGSSYPGYPPPGGPGAPGGQPGYQQPYGGQPGSPPPPAGGSQPPPGTPNPPQ